MKEGRMERTNERRVNSYTYIHKKLELQTINLSHENAPKFQTSINIQNDTENLPPSPAENNIKNLIVYITSPKLNYFTHSDILFLAV